MQQRSHMDRKRKDSEQRQEKEAACREDVVDRRLMQLIDAFARLQDDVRGQPHPIFAYLSNATRYCRDFASLWTKRQRVIGQTKCRGGTLR